MDGLQAAWDHDQSSSSSSLLWGSFANNKLIMDHLAAEDQEHFFLNPIPHFIHSNIHHNKAQDSAGNTTSSLRMASPAGFGADVDPSYSISVDGSMESLDCLLTSASNSNTATTTTTTSAEDVDDESISLIFSSAGNFWNTPPPPPPPPPLPTAATGETCRKPSHHNNSSRAAGKRKVETGGNKKTNHHHHLPLNPPKAKKPRHSYTSATSISENNNVSTNISFQQSDSSLTGGSSGGYDEPDQEAIAQMKEMIYRAAAFRPVNIGGEETAATQRPKRKNVRISTDPQTVAARQRRERISERIRILQKLVPGGNKMDTASMLDEAANYLKFLRSQVKALENAAGHTKISTSASTSPTTLQSFPLVVPTNLTFSSPSSIPTTTTTNYGENSISGLLLPMQPQNNFSSLVLQNPSNLLYQYHHHHQPQV